MAGAERICAALPTWNRSGISKDQMKSLTVCYITCRKNHKFEWFMDSLKLQPGYTTDIKVIRVDLYCDERHMEGDVLVVPPKPNVWQGKHRKTKENWWAIANAKNTGICLCETEWFSTADDRSVLVPTWLGAVKEAMEKNYVVAGAYEKVHNLRVENG